MERILFFRKAKGRNDIPTYRVQILRTKTEGFIIYYIQLAGQVQETDFWQVQGEMYKVFCRLQDRYYREEKNIPTYLAWEEDFGGWLRNAGQEQDWAKLWKIPVYSDYYKPDNVKWLLDTIPRREWPRKAIVLGSGMGMKEWLPYVVPYVQSVELYVEFLTKGLEQLREELCEEYGMVTDLMLVAPGEFAKERLCSREPVLVIDFAGAGKRTVLGLAKGSIWVDMDSCEEKRHLMEDRPSGVSYLSLKTIWKREMQETLDTISNFAYNT